MKLSKIFPILTLPICLIFLVDCAQPVTNVIKSEPASPATGSASSNPGVPTPKVAAQPASGQQESANDGLADNNVVNQPSVSGPSSGQINPNDPQDALDPLGAGFRDFTLTSEAFNNFGEIPNDFVAKNNGGNISMPLSWSNVPPGTGSFAIQMVDLDFRNPPFIHWAISDIPATTTDLPAGIDGGNDLVSPREALGANQAVDYRGPNPPALHNYEITIYAIRPNAIISLGQDSALNKALLESNSLGKSVIVGTAR